MVTMLIESSQVIFRGESYFFPEEIWSVKDEIWKPYKGRVPKEPGWVISFRKLMLKN